MALRTRTLVLGVLWLAAAEPLAAAVVEKLKYEHYAVDVDADQTLREAINAASPVREGKRVYHGRTTWDISWHFRWRIEGKAQCRITRVDTLVSSTILLPDLRTASARQRRRFDTYIEALRTHELGHHALAKDAAQRIDDSIRRLPPAADCETLERTANNRGQQLLDEYRGVEKQYDLSTGHGRTQGASLDD